MLWGQNLAEILFLLWLAFWRNYYCKHYRDVSGDAYFTCAIQDDDKEKDKQKAQNLEEQCW